MNLGRVLPLLALASLTPVARAYLLIDDFVGGYHKDTITGDGNSTYFANDLDRGHTLAGHRFTNYIANPGSNQQHYISTFEVGLGEARVTTPGPLDMSTELKISYGTIRLDWDFSAYTDPGRFIEIDLATDPPDLFAQTWSIYLADGHSRAVSNETFGTRPGGIEFRRDGFVGNQEFDWSDIQVFIFRQDWNAQNTAPLTYSTTEIRVVPEPTGVGLATTVGGLLLGRRRRPS